MRIGLIDCDKTKFPNLALMKLSAWHKSHGDIVEWYQPFSERYDKVYIAKVFSTTPDYDLCINADKVVRGGTGYDIRLVDGREVFTPSPCLPYEVEHIYPDYDLYGITDTAYGFLTRGCPRGCDFCIVAAKEGKKSVKVADLSEFWRGQKNIVLRDPNILACKDWRNLLQQVADSKANIDFNQGLDIRLMTKEKAELLNQCKLREIHFAWDRYQDKEVILRNLALYSEHGKFKPQSHNAIVYTIVNFDTTFEQDLERIYTLREMGYWAYVMIYDKTQSVSFNGSKYLDISSLNDALTDFAKSLPFSVENYNPSLNEKCRISYCLDDYLSSIGFVYDGLEKMTKGSAYSLKSSNPYYPKQESIKLILHIDDDGKGLVVLIDDSEEYRAVHSEFNGLEEAIGAINTVIEPIMLCIASQMVKHYSNISETRKKHNIGVLCTVDWQKLESFNEELKPKLIASLEEALKRLKEE